MSVLLRRYARCGPPYGLVAYAVMNWPVWSPSAIAFAPVTSLPLAAR
jgi:hypothetical protein